MKTSLSVTIAVVVLVIACLALGATGPEPGCNEAMIRLKQRVSMLEQRVERLEKKLQAIPTGRRPATIRPTRPPGSQSRPQGWRRREFNGVPYYVIPIQRTPRR